jgi:hypothetical protein
MSYVYSVADDFTRDNINLEIIVDDAKTPSLPKGCFSNQTGYYFLEGIE